MKNHEDVHAAEAVIFENKLPAKNPMNKPVKPAAVNIIRRDSIDDETHFRNFGCTVPNGSPATPDLRSPDVRNKRQFATFDLTMPDSTIVRMWTFRDPTLPIQWPAHAIRVREGQLCQTELTVSTGTHTIHHHGIEPTSMNDGVGKLSFEVGSKYIYQWYAGQSGTFFYHCHVNTVLHFEMGLYGALIVDPPQGQGWVRKEDSVIEYDVEGIWVADDINASWRALTARAGIACLFSADDPGLNINQSNYFVISGVPHPDTKTDSRVVVNAQVGQRVLIRLINASYTILKTTIEGLDAEVIEVDGKPLGQSPHSPYSRPFTISAGTPFELTTAQRYGMLITPELSGNYKVTMQYQQWVHGGVLGTAETFINVTDSTPPTGTVTINNGALFTNNPTAGLKFTSTETKFARMRFSDNATALASASYQAFSQTGSFTFPGTNGVKTIYAQFKDAAGNESSVVSSSIELDTGLPTGIVSINEGARFTNNRNVNLALNAEDAATFVTHMRFAQSEAALAGTSYKPFALSDTLTLSGGEGTKTVFAQFKDAAGNESLVVSDSIIYDTAPTGLVSINNGAAYTRSTAATLKLTCNDFGSGCSFVRRGSTLAELAVAVWEPFAPTMPWALVPGDGKKEVYVQYRDHEGNVSAPFSDFIYLDTVAPRVKARTAVTITKVLSNRWRVVGFPDDPQCPGRSNACSTESRMIVKVFNSRGRQISIKASRWVLDGRVAAADFALAVRGRYTARVYFEDRAGNLRLVKSQTIVF